MTIPAPWISQLTRTFVRKNNLTPSDMDVTDVRNPKFVSNTGEETGDKNMKATFLFKSSGGNYQGSELFTYKTVNLERLFLNNSIPVVWGYNPHTTKDIAKLLIDQYGLSMHEDWFIEEPVDGSLLPTYFTIKTKSTDYCSASQLTVRVEQSEKDVAELFAVDVLDAPNYPDYGNSTNVRYAPQHTQRTYPLDFTPLFSDQKEQLYSIVAGSTKYFSRDYQSFYELVKEVLSADIPLVDVIDYYKPVPNNVCYLGGWFCRYHGTTKDFKYNNISADTSYDKILLIEPSWVNSSLGGNVNTTAMFIHYNDV